MRSVWMMAAVLALTGCSVADQPPRIAEAPLYCYKTLAMNGCYDTPATGRSLPPDELLRPAPRRARLLRRR